MFVLKLLLFLALVYTVRCKNNLKSLTESMGQEVIEIGPPIKELPPGLEEEPSAEQDDLDDDISTTVTIPPATKKETKKTTKLTTKGKPETANQLNQDDEEMKIEKELSEIYKDTDYKSDLKETLDDDKIDFIKDESQVLRQKAKSNFKFQPDSTNKADIEKFRTSVDEISCEKGITKSLKSSDSDDINKSYQLTINSITFGLAICTSWFLL